MKWYFKILIIVVILILGWLIYENLTALRHNDQLSDTLNIIRARNAELIDRLANAQDRIAEIKGELAEIEQTSERLGNSLRGSQEKLVNLRKQFDNLRTENQRLTAILNRGTDSAAGIRAESEIIAESLDNALDIVGRLEEVYTGE